jgi:hypothetical protein
MSSGEVGSSIQYGSNSASRPIQPIASGTPQISLASMATGNLGPAASRARKPHPAEVLGRVGTDLQLDHSEPVGDRLAAQPNQLLVVVVQPTWRRRVSGMADVEQLRDPIGSAGLSGAQDPQRLVLGEGVAQIRKSMRPTICSGAPRPGDPNG